MARSATKPLSAEDRQFNKNKWLFSFSGIGRDMSYQLIASFLLVYVQFGATLNVAQFTTVSLIIGIVGRIWDAVNDPMMGAIIEGTHMKWGKFKPWILIGAVTCGAVIIMMFNIPVSVTGWNFVVLMCVLYLLWETTFTMNDIGYWSMLASLSSKKEQRNSIATLTVMFAGLGAFIGQGGISFLYPGNVRQAFSWISVAVVVIFVSMQTVTAVFVKERPRTAVEKSSKISLKHMWRTIRQNDQILWMTLIMLFYNIASSLLVALAYNLYYIEIGYDGQTIIFIAIFGVINIFANLIYPALSRRWGRKKVQNVSIIVACVGYAGIALLGWTSILPFELWTLSLFGVLVFGGQAIYYMSCIINMTNCVEYNEYKRGERNEAVISTLRPFMAKFADALKYVIVTLVLAVSGVFLLSQNISTMETQKNYFARIESYEAKQQYVTSVQKYLNDYNLDPEASDYAEKVAEINKLLEQDEVLSKYQIQAEYLGALGDVRIAVDGKVSSTLKDVDASVITADNFKNVTIEISGDGFNAANENFAQKGTLSMRLWLRASVSVLPMVLLIVSLVIQNKKFIIDEKYYDMMMEEIEKRKQGEPDGRAEETL